MLQPEQPPTQEEVQQINHLRRKLRDEIEALMRSADRDYGLEIRRGVAHTIKLQHDKDFSSYVSQYFIDVAMRKLTESGVEKPEEAAVPVCIVDISRTDEGQGFAVDFYMGGVRLDEAAKPGGALHRLKEDGPIARYRQGVRHGENAKTFELVEGSHKVEGSHPWWTGPGGPEDEINPFSSKPQMERLGRELYKALANVRFDELRSVLEYGSVAKDVQDVVMKWLHDYDAQWNLCEKGASLFTH